MSYFGDIADAFRKPMQLLKGTDTSTLASGTSIMIWMLVLYLNRDNTALNEEIKGVANLASRLCP
ncbi:hypothetical protein F2Q69_00007415 [Brassica cretica]|uniref:Uncharacterized protein n=2 Tax=Brassica cretica TaxID=69181 RepID=A0ABQ7BSD8_BRACR|nr:hypothetical protein F2Q69_00007415 [Brassica cretica]KAF3542740.1 hypothetical protein DY000_02008144 [Brassica cretica]